MSHGILSYVYSPTHVIRQKDLKMLISHVHDVSTSGSRKNINEEIKLTQVA